MRSESGRIPATIGPYRVQREIGRGAAGVVYSVTREGAEGTFALKLIRDLEGIDHDGLVRFQREAQLSSRLNHPGVVGALDAGAVGRHRYLVLPYVEGESLAQRLRRERVLPPEDAATLVGRVADALAAVHAAGVVHRDIKPDNILLDQHQGGAPRLTDFGIAREGHGRGSLTQSSAFLGTPAYMAPEQIQAASRVDGKADVYSLASVLYECLSGLPPFQGATTFQVADQVLHSEAPHLSDVAPEVPRSMAEACHAALSKDPNARPDAATFAKLLEASVKEAEAPARGKGPQILLGVAVVAGLVAVGGWIAFQATSSSDLTAASPGSQPEPKPSASVVPPKGPRGLAELQALTQKPAPLDSLLVEELRAAIADPERTGPAALILGDYQARRGDLRAAQRSLSQVPEETPEWRRAALLRSRILLRIGRNSEADALETDLLLQDLEDSVGKLIRARRLLSWRRLPAALELLRPLLDKEPPDPVALDLALVGESLSPSEAERLLTSPTLESDPDLLVHLSRLQDADAAAATVKRAEALCAPRPCVPALVGRLQDMITEGGEPRTEVERLVRELYQAEPSSSNLLMLVMHGELPEPERLRLAERLRRDSPTSYGVMSRVLGEPFARPANELATPFFPGDESWTWARERVADIPGRARRHAFRALTAAIGGSRPWSYVSSELKLAIQADDSGPSRDLAAEICVRRGRTNEALEFAGGEASLRPALRAHLEFYRGHDAAGFQALGELKGRLPLAEAALARGEPEQALEHLARLEETVDVRLARFDAEFALEQKTDAIGNESRGMQELKERSARGADETAEGRVAMRATLARVQAQIGCLDFRLGVSYGLLELKNSLRPQGPRDPGHPRNPIHRAVHYAGEASSPCTYFVRRVLYYVSHQKPPRQLVSVMYWGGKMVNLITGALSEEPSPSLDLYLAILDLAGGQRRVLRARQRDPKVQLAEHLLPITKVRFRDSSPFVPKD